MGFSLTIFFFNQIWKKFNFGALQWGAINHVRGLFFHYIFSSTLVFQSNFSLPLQWGVRVRTCFFLNFYAFRMVFVLIQGVFFNCTILNYSGSREPILMKFVSFYCQEFFYLFFIIDRFELSSNYISYWKLFWQISYRKDTLLKGVPNSFRTSWGSNSYRWERCKNKPHTLPLCC